MAASKPLEGRIAIVTGGGRGLGRAIALAYAGAGAKGIVLTAARHPAEIEAVAAEIDGIAGKGTALPLIADVTDRAACKRAIDRTIERFGAVDVLVNNAGRGQRAMTDDNAPFWEGNPDGWAEIVDTNINGPFNMAHAAIRPMMDRGWGRILNVTKSRDSMHRVNDTPYGPTKAALEAMTLAWAQDLLNTGVTVNSIAPGGSVDTEFVLPASRARGEKSGKLYMDANVIGPLAVFLASDAADGLTGCRYIAKNWRADLRPADAAEAAREPAIFLPPARDSLLTKTWIPPAVS
jgi:NAD(P)-dependent dehydrogenase (short-subunit alcohol dehydrogenase family)